MKTRENGKQSRPDAELIQVLEKSQSKRKKLYIVIDAKFYSKSLSLTTIEKTIDDMELRKAFGLIICSSETKLSESIDINLQKHKDKLKII